MAKWEHGKGFEITGYVSRKFVPPSGKCAFLTIETPGDRGKPDKTEMVGFGDLVVEMGSAKEGDVVRVTGTIGTKSLQNKAHQDVTVDDRKVWLVQLIARTIEIEGRAAASKPALGETEPDAPASAAPASRDWEKDGGVDW